MPVRNFISGAMKTQGSKIELIFQQFDGNPTVVNPGLLTVSIKYPVYGSNTPTVETLLTCTGVQVERDIPQDRHVITANLDGEIHDTDQVVTTQINLPQGWASVGDEESGAVSMALTNNSTVDYPKPIVSWDEVPHGVYPKPSPLPVTTFSIDIAAFHAYSWPGSPFGDLNVSVTLRANGPHIQTVQAVPTGKVSERAGFSRSLIYRASFLIGDLPDDQNATIEFTITPSRGDAASILTSTPYSETNTWDPSRSTAQGGPGVQPNVETLRIITRKPLDSTIDVAPRYVVVAPGGTDNPNRGVFLNKFLARLPGNWFASIEGAKVSAGTTGIPADIDNLNILMFAGKFRYGPAPTSQTSVPAPTVFNSTRPLVIVADDGVTREQVEITNAAFSLAFNVPQEGAMSLRNDNSVQSGIIYDWRGSEFLIIRDVTNGPDFGQRWEIERNQTLDQMKNDIEDELGLEVSVTILNNHGNWIATREAGHFPGTSVPVEFGPQQSVDVQGQVDTAITIAVGSMSIAIGAETTPPYLFGTFTTAQALVTQIIADWQTQRGLLIFSEVIRNINTNILGVLTAQIIPSAQSMTFFENEREGNEGARGIQHAYVEFRNVTLRSIELGAATAAGKPPHLFLDQIKMKEETRGSGFSARIPATAAKWLGGVWSRRCDWDTVNQCTKAWVMVRDAFFQRVGADVGREISYACNWTGEDINPIPGDDRHGDLFQWFPGNPTVHGNIIAVNFNFRQNLGAQPFLLNPDGTGHTYRGVAFVNWRTDAALQQQISGSGDHILFLFCTLLQGCDSSRRVSFRAEAAGDKFHNLRIVNLVCEQLRLGFQENGPRADMASLWSILDNDHIIVPTGLEDENGTVANVAVYPACTSGGSVTTLFQDFAAGNWHPVAAGALNNRPVPARVVYRYDAEGADRTLANPVPIGALLV